MTNPFSEQYKKLSNSELLEIINRQSEYQALAAEAARVEFENRKLTDEEIAKANAVLEEKENAKYEAEQKLKEMESRVKSAGASLIDNLNPVQSHKSSASYINLVSLSLLIIFLVQFKNAVDLILFYFNDKITYRRDGFELLLYTAPVIYLFIATLLFWKRHRTGWVLLFLYSLTIVLMAVYSFIKYACLDFSFLDNTFMRPIAETLFIQLLVYGSLLLFLIRKSIREIYGIKLPERAV